MALAYGRLLDAEAAPRKTLHVVVTDVDEEEAEELGLTTAIEAQVSQLWERVIKPGAAAEAEKEEAGAGEEEEQQRGLPEWAEQLSVNVVCLPSKAHAGMARAAALTGLKAALEAKLARGEEGAFVPAKELEASLAAMAPVSKGALAGAAAVPKADSVVAAYYLDKVRAVGVFIRRPPNLSRPESPVQKHTPPTPPPTIHSWWRATQRSSVRTRGSCWRS